MNDNPVNRPDRAPATFWLWFLLGGGLLLLAYLFRFPWGWFAGG
jgi:hypothetical protein